MLTALACAVSAMPVLTVSSLSWEEPTQYMVVEVSTNANGDVNGLTLREPGSAAVYEISNCGADMEAMLEGQETPEWGDIISLSPPYYIAEVIPGCLHYGGAAPEYENLGNITEIGTLEYLTVEGYDQTTDGRITQCQLADENNNSYLYYPDEDYGIPAPDMTESKEGLYYLYNGEVLLWADESTVNCENVPWTATGIVIGPNLIDIVGHGDCTFDDTIDSSGDPIGAGDVVELKLRGSVAEIYPCQLPAIEHVDRLGTAAELYGYGEYTVTENDGTQLVMTNTAGEEKTYSYWLQTEMGYALYNSDLVIDAKAGDVITFMHSKSGNPILPTNPEELYSRTEFVVIGVDDAEHPEDYIIIESGSPTAVYQLSAGDIAAYLANGGEPLSYGDIFTLAGDYAYTCIWGTNDIMLSYPETIRIEGSVFDKAETAEFAFNSASASTFVWLDGEEKGYQYPVDFMIGTGLMFNSDFIQPDGIDWTKPELGDQITMYTYNGVPMFPKSMQRIGDADGDHEVNASDAAEMLIIAAENGAGARNAVTFSNDVNSDGVTDAADAAAVLIYAAARGTGTPIPWEEILA